MAVKKMALSGFEWRIIRFALREYAEIVQHYEDGEQCRNEVENLYKKIATFTGHTGDGTPTEVTRVAWDWEI